MVVSANQWVLSKSYHERVNRDTIKGNNQMLLSQFRPALLLSIITVAGLGLPAHSQERQPNSLADGHEFYLRGIAKPQRLVELSARVEGLIAQVSVKEGDSVEAQQVLAIVQDDEAKASVKIARIEAEQTGELSRAELDWKFEAERYQRLQSVVSQNATSELELWEKAAIRDQKKATLQTAQDQQKLAQARLEKAITEWNKHKIVAPFKGQVIEIHKKAGTQPKNFEKVITVADLSKLEVVMHLPMLQLKKYKPGDQVTVVAEAPVSQKIVAEVQSVSPLINPTSETFRCVLLIDNRDLLLPAGFLVSLKSE